MTYEEKKAMIMTTNLCKGAMQGLDDMNYAIGVIDIRDDASRNYLIKYFTDKGDIEEAQRITRGYLALKKYDELKELIEKLFCDGLSKDNAKVVINMVLEDIEKEFSVKA